MFSQSTAKQRWNGIAYLSDLLLKITGKYKRIIKGET
jgi:hypothetical protein